MLHDERFVRWATDHLVPLVAHNERLHDSVEEEGEGETVARCTLYPGISCRDHVRAAVDVDNAREEDLVKVPFVELCPNTWLVAPTGEVLRVEEDAQFDPKAVRERAEALQERLGASLAAKAFPPCRERLERAEAAADEERWRDALEALASLAEPAPKPTTSLEALVATRLSDLDEGVRLAAEDALEAEAPGAEDRALVEGLLAATDVAVYGRRLPVREALSAWLATRR